MTVKSSGELISDITNNITSAGDASITGTKVRTIFTDIVNSNTRTTIYSNTNSGALVLDLAQNVSNITLSGHVTGMTTTNRYSSLASACKIMFYAGAADRNLAFSSSWKWIGIAPSGIPATRYGLLTLTNFGNNETDILASYELVGSGV